MRILRSREELRGLRKRRAAGPLVFVPTMGAFHDGHLDLVRRAVERGPTVVSIFVNPRQFGPDEDFAAYPRPLERDLELLAPLAPAAVFVPDAAAVYGRGDGVSIRPGRFATGLCGADRPGHFGGVLTVVARLFGLVRPDLAVFGRKDAQQCLAIAEMVRDLGLAVRLLDAPTVREADGLAMSSRNAYLSPDERQRAVCLWQGLDAARTALADGERDAGTIRGILAAGLAAADAVDYVAARRVEDWSEPERLDGRTLLAVAAQVGPARLIDNLVLDITGSEVRDAALLDPEDEE